MKKIFLALASTTALSSAEFLIGGGFTHYYEDVEGFGNVNLSIAYGSISYEILSPNSNISFIPELRIGAGISNDSIDNFYLGNREIPTYYDYYDSISGEVTSYPYGTTSERVYTDIEFSVNSYVAILFNVKYDWGKVYGLANVNATYMDLEASASTQGTSISVSEDDWTFGAGVGLGIKLTENVATELKTELYSVSDSIALSSGIGFSFSF